jgi:hypothetical protein
MGAPLAQRKLIAFNEKHLVSPIYNSMVFVSVVSSCSRCKTRHEDQDLNLAQGSRVDSRSINPSYCFFYKKKLENNIILIKKK